MAKKKEKRILPFDYKTVSSIDIVLDDMKEIGYSNVQIEHIMGYCRLTSADAVKWLKAEAKKKVEFKVYPQIEVVDEDGKKKKKADKSQPYTVELRKIPFTQLKLNFYNRYLPDLAPKKKEKQPTMYDLIDLL